jgi:hypothetical protein
MHKLNHKLNRYQFRGPLPPCRLRLEALEDRSLPSTLTVTSIADAGAGTLRDAISKANSGDKIVFALPNHSTISLTSGPLQLSQSIVISGPGPAALTISGNHSFSVIGISSPITFATISGLRITGGGGQSGGGILNGANLSLFNCVISGNSVSMDGGGIDNGANGILSVTNCTVSQNSAVQGGGIETGGVALSITNCTISGNSATQGGGGGVDNSVLGGLLSITGSTISGNSAGQGGGINVSGSSNTTITGSTISSNHAGVSGGGINNGGTMVIQRSTVSGNMVPPGLGTDAFGGGIFSTGSLVIHDSAITGNSVTGGQDAGGGSGGMAQGGGINCQGTLTIVNSTIAGNQATGGVGAPISGSNAGSGVGGGIYADSTALTLANCTIAGNIAQGGSASGGSGANGSAGGLFYLSNNPASIPPIAINCTIAANHGIAGTGSSGSGFGEGGGLFSGSNFVLQNTIVATNTATSDRPDIVDPLTTSSSVFNLIGDGTGSNLMNGSNGNQVGSPVSPIDPKLNALANYGGTTPTMALLPGSPAIDTGSNAIVTMNSDQRGLTRIVSGTVDVGAFEFQPLHFLVVGADLGHAPEVKVFDASSGALRLDFNAYEPTFSGGVRVAAADINGDGVPDIITAPGGVKVSLVNVNGALFPSFDLSRGRAPEIKVFSGVDGTKLADFLAYPASFNAGVFVAVANINVDSIPDIITGPDATGQSGHANVRVFFGNHLINTGAALMPDREFNAYNPGFGGGVRVAAASGNSFANIVTAPGIWSGPDIRIFDGSALAVSNTASKIGEFLAYDPRYFGGVFVSVGDVNGDGVPDIITGTNGFGGPEVKAFSGSTVLSNPVPTIIDDFFAYDPAFSGGARVAVMDVNGDGKADIVTGAGPGGGPHVRIFDGGTGLQLQQNTTDSFMAFDPSFSGGVFVGGA